MSEQKWELIDHVCRVCFSRLVAAPGVVGQTQYRCTGCGLEGHGSHPRVVCSCGLTLRPDKNMGVRCVKNDKITPEVPFEIVARQIEPSGR